MEPVSRQEDGAREHHATEGVSLPAGGGPSRARGLPGSRLNPSRRIVKGRGFGP